MKTFKQLREELPEPVTPKQFDVYKSDLRFIRTPDIIKRKIENLEVNTLCLLISLYPKLRKTQK